MGRGQEGEGERAGGGEGRRGRGQEGEGERAGGGEEAGEGRGRVEGEAIGVCGYIWLMKWLVE